MDNQSIPSDGPSPNQPLASSEPNVNPNLGSEPINETPTPPTDLPATDNVVYETPRKKHSKAPKIILICVLAALLIGGIAFAAAYIINNQPANILMSAIGNLTSAERVGIDGSVDFTIENSEDIGVSSFNLKFDDQYSGLSNSATATLNINFTDGTKAPTIKFGEVMLSEGVLYVEANGLRDFYNGAFRENIKTTLMNQMLYGYQVTTIENCTPANDASEAECLDETQAVIVVDPNTEAAASQAIDNMLDQIGEIINSIDGQWVEIYIDDVLDSDMLTSIPYSTRESISSAYKCVTGVLNQATNYSGELSNLYSQNPFLNMTAGVDSFYDISIDATNLAGYLNAIPKTKFASDLSACYNSGESIESVSIDAEDLSLMLESAPQLSAKFDGIFSHRLTELKINSQNEFFKLNSDLKFSYPNSINVSAPADHRPIMDVVEEIYQELETIQAY